MSSQQVALIYTRQSVSQFDAEGHAQGPSLDQQLDAVKRRPEFQGVTVEHFQDADRSGKETSKRPGYQALMQRLLSAAPGEIAAVGFYDQDRLHRNAQEFYEFMNALEKRNIAVFDASGPIRNEDELSWGIKAVVASAERRKIAKRVKDNLSYLRRQGRLLGTLPAGYRREAGTVVIDEATAPTIRRIFELYGTGDHSLRTLALRLNQDGVKPITARGGNGGAPAPLWSADVIKEIIERPTYAGLLPVPREARRRGDTLSIAGTHPAIISLELWERCQNLRTRHRPGLIKPRRPASLFPLTSLLRCGECGGPMRGKRTGNNGFPYFYYACSSRCRYGPYSDCHAPLVRADALEAELVDWLAKCHPSDQVEQAARDLVKRGLQQQRTAPSELSERRTVKQLDARLERCRNLYKLGDISLAEYQRDKANIEGELARLKALPHVPTVRQSSRRLTDLVAAWKDATPDERHRMAASILSVIEVKDGSIVAFRPRPAWLPYFEQVAEYVPMERETGLEPATMYLEGTRSTS